MLTKIRRGAVEDALPVVFHGPMGQKAKVCVHPRRLERWHFLSRTLLHPMPGPCGAQCELNGNKSSMREWGEQGNRKLGKWIFLFWPCSRTVLVSHVLLSQRSPTSRPCCPPPASASVSLQCPFLLPWPLGTKSVTPLQQVDGVPGSHGHPCSSSVTHSGVKNHRSWKVSFQSAELFDFLSQQCSFPWLQFVPQPKIAVRHAHCVCGGTTSHPACMQTNKLFCRTRMLETIATSCNRCLSSAATEVRPTMSSQTRIFTKFGVRSRSVCAGAPWYCYFNQ